jgi:6-pyruvoyltetrahydropterin/6-carboxytetrahydropterin synthase
MFTVTIESVFTASHQLTFGGGRKEALHEHRWHVRAAVQSRELDETGLVMDFHELQRLLKDILDRLDGKQLEATGYLDGRNTSAENVAKFIYDMLSPKMPPDRLVIWVEVTEAPGCRARYSVR